jgi:hypothetical protein
MGLGPIKGGEVHFIMTPAGAIPVEMLGEFAKDQMAKLAAGNNPKPNTGVVEPVSGIGTDTFGKQNPSRAVTKQEVNQLSGRTSNG